VPTISCRQIGEPDIAAVVALLTRGFDRSQQFWLDAVDHLRRHEPPSDLPKYGYLLEADGAVVGALLLICSTIRNGDRITTRCNLSSWCVEPAYRVYAALLVGQALRHKDVTYLNISPAQHTWPIIEAQGFARYCDGVFVAAPMLNGLFGNGDVKVFEAQRTPAIAFNPLDQELLLRHAEHGCISLWCETPVRAYPFVFRTRRVRDLIPCAQLIYCADMKDFVRCAGPLGRYLVRRGRPLIVLDANAPIPGLVGVFRPGVPRYFKGPQRPRIGDLAYTEYAVLGV
jgi:hypothetical protein